MSQGLYCHACILSVSQTKMDSSQNISLCAWEQRRWATFAAPAENYISSCFLFLPCASENVLTNDKGNKQTRTSSYLLDSMANVCLHLMHLPWTLVIGFQGKVSIRFARSLSGKPVTQSAKQIHTSPVAVTLTPKIQIISVISKHWMCRFAVFQEKWKHYTFKRIKKSVVDKHFLLLFIC